MDRSNPAANTDPGETRSVGYQSPLWHHRGVGSWTWLTFWRCDHQKEQRMDFLGESKDRHDTHQTVHWHVANLHQRFPCGLATFTIQWCYSGFLCWVIIMKDTGALWQTETKTLVSSFHGVKCFNYEKYFLWNCTQHICTNPFFNLLWQMNITLAVILGRLCVGQTCWLISGLC